MHVMEMLSLKGKVALVTGGSGRYGRPMVEALAEAGAIVITASRTLDKNEEYAAELRESFSFSDALRDVVETYEVIAKQSDVRMEYALADEISYSGSKAEVQQLMGILLDNACKYCPNGGVIRIIAKQSFHGVKLCVSNTATPVSKKDTEMLTQRFHRGENATGKTGFGLGLSIAEAIANRHNGQLTVSTTTKDVFSVEVVLH